MRMRILAMAVTTLLAAVFCSPVALAQQRGGTNEEEQPRYDPNVDRYRDSSGRFVRPDGTYERQAASDERQAGSDERRRGGQDQSGTEQSMGTGAQATAVADERSNSVVVIASEETMKMVEALIAEIESLTQDLTEFRVFALEYADANDVADAITTLFEEDQSRSSTARRSLRRVRAESDDRTNSILVCAPEDVMTTIERMVKELDMMSEDVTEVRVFPLHNADAEMTAQVVADVFKTQSQSTSSDSPRRFGGGAFGMFGGRGGNQGNQNQRSERQVQEETVVAVADTRTNSVVVRAASEIMVEVAKMVEAIDANPAKKKQVRVFSLENANVEEIGAILESMFGSQTGRTNITNRGTQTGRTTTGQTGGTSTRGSTRGSTGGSTGGTSTRGGSSGSDTGFGSLR